MLKLISERLLNAQRPQIFGMVHVPALPGTPLNRLSISEISNKVKIETRQYSEAGVDGIIYENMHDLPYIRSELIGSEVISSMTRVCVDGVRELGEKRNYLLLGVQILAQGNKQAIAVAQSAELDFIRAECFVFSHVADEGWMDSCAGELLRYRKTIGADHIGVITDIKKKHSAHSVTSDVSLAETSHAAEFFQADGLIVTGQSTGDQAQPVHLEEVRSSTSLPVLIGSGITLENWKNYSNAHGFIIGSYFKEGGDWRKDIVTDKVKKFIENVKSCK